MTSVAFAVATTLMITNGVSLAQPAEDPILKLRACSVMGGAARQDCLDRLSRTMTAEDAVPVEGEKWIISETTSPVDYSPIITATILSSGGSAGAAMKLLIRCRGGRTELLLEGPGAAGPDRGYSISLRVNDNIPFSVPATASASGAGVAIGGDVVHLLQSMPDNASLAVHVATRTGSGNDAVFALSGIESVRAKMMAPCRWPQAAAPLKN